MTNEILDHILYITVRAKGKQMNTFKKAIATLAVATTITGCATQNAQAGGTEEILIALGTAFLFNEIYKDKTEGAGKVDAPWGSEHNPLNEVNVVTQGIETYTGVPYILFEHKDYPLGALNASFDGTYWQCDMN